MGDRHSSPNVCSVKAPSSHAGLTSAPVSARRAPATRREAHAHERDADRHLRRRARVAPALGEAHPHRREEGREDQDDRRVHRLEPRRGDLERRRTIRRVCSAAKRFIEEPACSKAAQKKMMNEKITNSARTCWRSVRGVEATARRGARALGGGLRGRARGRCPAGNGALSTRYITRPMTMPTPAAPKPQCQPKRGLARGRRTRAGRRARPD